MAITDMKKEADPGITTGMTDAEMVPHIDQHPAVTVQNGNMTLALSVTVIVAVIKPVTPSG